MKKLLFALLAVGSLSSAQGQSAGSILVYGDLGFNSNSISDSSSTDKVNSWYVSPGIGYQFNDHWTGGINISVAGSMDKPQGSPALTFESSTMDLRLGLFGRCTHRMGNIFFIFGQLDLSYLSGNQTDKVIIPGSTTELKNTYSGFGVNLFPGVGVNVSKCMALNFGFGGLGYETTTWTIDSGVPAAPSLDITNNNFNLTFGQQFHFGISANFGGQKMKKGNREPMDETRKIDTSDSE